MKKLAASILFLLYFVVSTGFVVSVHYCMNEVNTVEPGHVTSEECGKCGMAVKESDGCCKDEIKVIKMQADQLLAKLATANFSLSLPASSATDFLFTPVFYTVEKAEPVAHGPPLSEQDTYIKNRVFRI